MKRDLVNDGKGRLYRIGKVQVILNGVIWAFSLSFGNAVTILIWEKNE